MSGSALAAVSKARSRLIMGQSFFGTLATGLAISADPRVGTAATDGKRLLFAPDFIDSLPEPEIEGVVCHEVLHCALDHIGRRQGRDPDQWNIACDYAINPLVLAAGLRLPAGALLSAEYDGLGAEDIYAKRSAQQAAKTPPPPPSQGKPQGGSAPPSQGGSADPGNGSPQGGTPGNGSGSGSAPPPNGAPSGQGSQGSGSAGPGAAGAGSAPADLPGLSSDPGQCGGMIDSAPIGSESEGEAIRADWQARVAQAIGAAKARGAGTLPGWLAGIAAELVRPRIDWKAALRRFTDDSTSRDISWSRPNRRHIGAGVYLPGSIPDRPCHVVAIIDSSGSMSDELIAALRSELQAMLDESAADKVTLAYADTRVREFAEYMPGDLIETPEIPRGGTAFRQPLQWAGERDPSAVVYMTDLDASDFGEEPAAPILWLVTGDPRQAAHAIAKAPFGEAVILGE